MQSESLRKGEEPRTMNHHEINDQAGKEAAECTLQFLLQL